MITNGERVMDLVNVGLLGSLLDILGYKCK